MPLCEALGRYFWGFGRPTGARPRARARRPPPARSSAPPPRHRATAPRPAKSAALRAVPAAAPSPPPVAVTGSCVIRADTALACQKHARRSIRLLTCVAARSFVDCCRQLSADSWLSRGRRRTQPHRHISQSSPPDPALPETECRPPPMTDISCPMPVLLLAANGECLRWSPWTSEEAPCMLTVMKCNNQGSRCASSSRDVPLLSGTVILGPSSELELIYGVESPRCSIGLFDTTALQL